MTTTPPPDRYADELAEALALHIAEWRGHSKAGRVLWVCTCGGWHGDDYADHQRHQAEHLIPVVAAACQAQAERVLAHIEGLAGDLWLSGDHDAEADAVETLLGELRATLAVPSGPAPEPTQADPEGSHCSTCSCVQSVCPGCGQRQKTSPTSCANCTYWWDR